MDKKLVRHLINKFMNMKSLLEYDGNYIAPNGTLYCPFHSNVNTKSAHYYDNDGGGQIFCFSEYKQYFPYDYYTILHPEINVTELAELIWSKLSDSEQKAFITNLGLQQQEYSKLPYLDALVQFKNGEITYKALMGYIHLALDPDELVDRLYNLPSVPQFNSVNKYLYYMNNYNSTYKLVSSIMVLNSIPNLPDFVQQHLQSVGDCIIIPNIIDNQVYSITFRSMNSDKRFLKYGEFTNLFYNLGNLPEDFTYGTPIIVCEGNLDTDYMSQFYPYTLGALTANLTTVQIQILTHLTNHIILAFDNDEAGNQGYYHALKNLKGMKVSRFKYNTRNKDIGDLLEMERIHDSDFEFIKSQYKTQIRLLIDN